MSFVQRHEYLQQQTRAMLIVLAALSRSDLMMLCDPAAGRGRTTTCEPPTLMRVRAAEEEACPACNTRGADESKFQCWPSLHYRRFGCKMGVWLTIGRVCDDARTKNP